MSTYLTYHYKNLQDVKIEDEILKQLIILEKELRDHNILVKYEINLQKKLVAMICTLSQRYIILKNNEPCSSFTEICTSQAEDCLLQEFTDKLQHIKNSNCHIRSSLNDLRKSCLVFDHLCSQLNMTKESLLTSGDAFQKPISYFIELISDLFKYFHAWFLNLNLSFHQLDPVKIINIENYKTQLEIPEDFEEYLNVGLTYCKCLRWERKC